MKSKLSVFFLVLFVIGLFGCVQPGTFPDMPDVSDIQLTPVLPDQPPIPEPTPVQPPEGPSTPTPVTDIGEATKILDDYLFETSDSTVPGKAIVILASSFTGKTLALSVNKELFTKHSNLYNGKEIWYGTKAHTEYIGPIILVKTEDGVYGNDLFPEDSNYTQMTVESLRYNGRANGDRPTWYGSKRLSQYPKTLTIDITGCLKRTITHDGHRYDKGGLIIKQSDVSGRGMAVVYSSSCKSKEAKAIY